MKQLKVIGALFVFALALAVSFDSYGGKIEKSSYRVEQTITSAAIMPSEQTQVSTTFLNPDQVIKEEIYLSGESLQYNDRILKPIRHQKYFYPLKFC